jgi:hypothetical protein
LREVWLLAAEDENFSVDRYCLGVYNEVFMALCGRVEK